MTRELYIDDQLIDLGSEAIVALTLQAHDLTDLQSRQGMRSNKFRIPMTQANAVALGFAGNMQSSSNKPYRKLPCRYLLDGAEIIADGYAIIEGTGNGFYNVTLYGGNIDFFSLIQGLKLSDLDLTDYDHEWNFDNIQASWLNTSGYKYPLIDYGDCDEVVREYNITRFRPAFFVHTLVNKIFSEQGYTVAGNLLTRADYLKLMLLFGTEQPEGVFTNSFGTIIGYDDWTTMEFAVGAPLATVDTIDTIGVGNGNVDEHFNLRFIISNTNPFAPDKYVKIYICDPFTATYTLKATYSGNGVYSAAIDMPNQTTVYERSILIEAKECYVQVIGGQVSGIGTTDPTKQYSASVLPSDVLQSGGIEKFAWAGLSANSDEIYFETSDMGKYAPNMSQQEFLLAIMNQFCLFPITDSLKREVRLVSFADVVANKSQQKDWTTLLHMQPRTHSLVPRKGAFAQVNYFTYQVDGIDETDLPPDAARGSIAIDDETLPAERTLVSLPFAASLMVNTLRNGVGQPSLPLPLIRMLEDEVFKNSVTARILVDDTTADIGDDISFYFADAGVSSPIPLHENIPLCYFQLLGKTFNAGFDDSLLPDNYQELAAMLVQFKSFTGMFNLKLADVVNFDFSTPVYLDQFAAWFYVNRINNFKVGQLTQVELIRIA